MKDDKKLNKKTHKNTNDSTLIQYNTLVMKAAQCIYIRRCIDSLLQTVKLIK